ncbi:MAG: hypothetical protein M1389_00400 [Chloroflexi bacterium]|nr:hypothetical protein [Chloroflexota bacterium]
MNQTTAALGQVSTGQPYSHLGESDTRGQVRFPLKAREQVSLFEQLPIVDRLRGRSNLAAAGHATPKSSPRLLRTNTMGLARCRA